MSNSIEQPSMFGAVPRDAALAQRCSRPSKTEAQPTGVDPLGPSPGSGYYRRDLAFVHHREFAFHAEAGAPGIRRLLDPVRAARGCVVELGCGSGHLTRHLVDAGLHVIATDASLLAKARRGALRIGLPVGLVYDDVGQVVLHPDAQVQETLRLFFRTFFRTGSACAPVKYFSDHQIPFPAPAKPGVKTDEVVSRSGLPSHSRWRR